jgi:tRNA U38,U39,U40 pseudouridine synthase TruA
MVRFLAAGMIEAGRGLLEKEQFGRMLASGDRSCRLVPVEASGLFLWKISYR